MSSVEQILLHNVRDYSIHVFDFLNVPGFYFILMSFYLKETVFFNYFFNDQKIRKKIVSVKMILNRIDLKIAFVYT